MMALALDLLSWALFISGGAFVMIGALGVLRFPDFYTRLHAAGVTDTLGADLILLGLILQSPSLAVMIKLLIIFLLVVLTSPVSTHAISHAAWVTDLRPRIGTDLRYAKTDEECGR